MALETAGDVRELVGLLSSGGGSAASVQGSAVAVEVQVEGDYGYILYSGVEGYVVSVGDPESPDIDSEAGHEAGSGLPLERFTEALIELVRTEALPSCVEWRAA